MGRTATAVMTSLEGGAGWVADHFFGLFVGKARRRATLIGSVGLGLAALCGLMLWGSLSALGRDRRTVEILRATGVRVDAPVVDLITTRTGKATYTTVVVQLPEQAGDRRVAFDPQRVPNPTVGVGESVAVIYSATDARIAVPAGEVTEGSAVRADTFYVAVTAGGLVLALLTLIFAVLLWRRAARGEPADGSGTIES